MEVPNVCFCVLYSVIEIESHGWRIQLEH